MVSLSLLQLDLQFEKVVRCAVRLDHVDPSDRSHREHGKSDKQLGGELLLISIMHSSPGLGRNSHLVNGGPGH